MDYRMFSAKEFVRESKKGNIDLNDFYQKLWKKLEGLDKKYGFFSVLGDMAHGPPEKGKLANLPVSAKDCICVKGMQSAAGSKILEGYKSPFDATCVEHVKIHGGKIIGKTNQDEFGFGTFSTNSGFRVPKNPLDPKRCCGGSSGGAAGLTAVLDFPHVALAESTGGSISCPASFCGVVGLTPTYGLVSRYGLIDYANSLDKIGTMGRTVEDAAFLLSYIAQHDSRDSTALDRKHMDYTAGLEEGVKGMRFGVPKEYFGKGVDKPVAELVRKKIRELEGLGAEVKEVSLPNTRYALAAYYIIACSEASTNLAKFCGMRYGASEPLKGDFNKYFSEVRSKYLGEEAKRRILLGTFARMAGYRDKYYLKALQVRTLIIEEFKRAFRKVDALMAPTMPVIAPKFTEIKRMSPLSAYAMDILTVGPNLAGIPQLSVPAGLVKGMPVGLHILGDHLQEEKILKAGAAVEGLE